MRTKIFLSIILVAFAMTRCVCEQETYIIKQNINVDNFTSINVSGVWEVIITQDTVQSVSIEVNEKFLDKIDIDVKNGVLNISNKRINHNFCYNNNDKDFKAYVSVTNLTELNVSEVVNIVFVTPLESENFKLKMSDVTNLDNLSIKCNSFNGLFSDASNSEIRFVDESEILITESGTSKVSLYDVNAEQCQVTLTDASEINLLGKTEQLVLNASDSGNVSANYLVAKVCIADFSDASNGKIYVTDNLNISVSDANSVVCYGNPQNVTQNISDAGTLRFVN